MCLCFVYGGHFCGDWGYVLIVPIRGLSPSIVHVQGPHHTYTIPYHTMKESQTGVDCVTVGDWGSGAGGSSLTALCSFSLPISLFQSSHTFHGRAALKTGPWGRILMAHPSVKFVQRLGGKWATKMLERRQVTGDSTLDSRQRHAEKNNQMVRGSFVLRVSQKQRQ